MGIQLQKSVNGKGERFREIERVHMGQRHGEKERDIDMYKYVYIYVYIETETERE